MEVQKDMKCIAPEYSICSKCKNNDTELCLDCITYYNNCAIYLCGVVVGFEQHFGITTLNRRKPRTVLLRCQSSKFFVKFDTKLTKVILDTLV